MTASEATYNEGLQDERCLSHTGPESRNQSKTQEKVGMALTS